MRFKTLPQWLQWQENLHFTAVDPGLERVRRVWCQLGGSQKLPFTVITVAGTNGKGSSVALLGSILCAAGYRTGTYMSPHLLHYNERICLDNVSCNDEQICNAFHRIDKARDDISLTYFEFSTLAAADIFCRQDVDVAILEVGMGGRLDAVNVFDTDIALITPIDLDHTMWLGTNREQIGREKAGIIRPNIPVVCSEKIPPQSIVTYAMSLDALIYRADIDFQTEVMSGYWHWSNSSYQWHNLPMPALFGLYQIQNAAAVLQVISLLIEQQFYITKENIETGLCSVRLTGRFQRISGDVERIFDVTHNRQGAENLARLLAETGCHGRTLAVLGMLKDKVPSAMITALKNSIDSWYVGDLDSHRGMTAQDLTSQLNRFVGPDDIVVNATIIDAYQQAMSVAKVGDRVLIFGSFLTVEAVINFISAEIE